MNINIILSFLTNFRPSNFSYLDEINFLKIRKNSKIVLKNFFLFLILLKYLTNKKKKFLNQSIWIKPTRRKLITILKAPYRHKLARNQLLLKRFFIFYRIKLLLNEKIEIKYFNKIIELVGFFKKFNFFLESSLIYQYKTKINFNFFYNDFFLLK